MCKRRHQVSNDHATDVIINCVKDDQSVALYLCIPETKIESVAHWLSVFYIVIFDFDKLWYDSLNSPVKNIYIYSIFGRTVILTPRWVCKICK